MDWLVRIWTHDGKEPKTECREFDDLNEAREFADKTFLEFEKQAMDHPLIYLEYDVKVYKRTNY